MGTSANQGRECWNQCGKTTGRCPGFCGGGLCCRKGYPGCPFKDGNTPHWGFEPAPTCVTPANPPNQNVGDHFVNSPKACNLHCQGFKYFGLEAGGQCFCGNTFDYLIKEPESECTKVCPGDKSKRCGGAWRLNIYRTTGPDPGWFIAKPLKSCDTACQEVGLICTVEKMRAHNQDVDTSEKLLSLIRLWVKRLMQQIVTICTMDRFQILLFFRRKTTFALLLLKVWIIFRRWQENFCPRYSCDLKEKLDLRD